MKQFLIRYFPLLLLAIAWEVVARLRTRVDDRFAPFVGRDLGGDSDGQGRRTHQQRCVFALSSRRRLGPGNLDRRHDRHRHGVVEAGERLVAPLVEIFYPLPKSALIPVTVIWLGFGDGSKILLIFLGCMLPVTIGAFNGARSSEQVLVWSARSMGASRLRMLWDVVVPSAMPELLNGIRTALALSFILLVSSELIVAQKGFGHLIGSLGANGSYDAMYAVVLTVAFLGFAADRLYLLITKRTLAWRD